MILSIRWSSNTTFLNRQCLIYWNKIIIIKSFLWQIKQFLTWPANNPIAHAHPHADHPPLALSQTVPLLVLFVCYHQVHVQVTFRTTVRLTVFAPQTPQVTWNTKLVWVQELSLHALDTSIEEFKNEKAYSTHQCNHYHNYDDFGKFSHFVELDLLFRNTSLETTFNCLVDVHKTCSNCTDVVRKTTNRWNQFFLSLLQSSLSTH